MSFHTTIARLREASRAASVAGEDPNTCRVGRQDLRTALHLIDRLDADLRQAGMLSQRAPVAALQWSEVTEPNEQIRYTHLLAESPLGRFSIEWKSWKPHDSYCVYLDGDYLDTSMDLDDAKAIALKKVADMAHALAGFAAPEASAPVAGEATGSRQALFEAIHRYGNARAMAEHNIAYRDEVRNTADALIALFDAAPQASEAVRDADHPVFTFLLGEGPLRGVEFGDRHPDERGAYWWRKDLRAALSVQPGALRTGCNCATCRLHNVEMRMILCEVCGDKRCPHAADHRNKCTSHPKQHNDGGAVYG